MSPVVRREDAREDQPVVDVPIRGERILRLLERALTGLERAIPVPDAVHPVKQAGALANLSLFTALISGVLLLFWYTPSVDGAWSSVAAMGESPLGAGLVRTLHRYSSDACMLFSLLHAARLFSARRFTGARWLAWVTGIALVGLLWVVGWTGYWLVWDARARQVALGTARLADALPIFADPLSRSFLTDFHLNSLLFFVVFFVHMLLPLGMGIALWLHIARVARSQFLTGRVLTVASLGAMVILSIAAPADLAAPARMAEVPGTFSMDAWYLLPLGLTDRLGAGALWSLVLLGGALTLGIPWLLGRGRARVAEVDAGRCNGCTLCYHDCPYDAIAMVDRAGGSPLSVIDPAKCVGCGICAGSCDSAAIGLDWFPVLAARQALDRQLEEKPGAFVAMVCNDAPEAPLDGYSTQRVPCAGWVQSLSVERALRHGAGGVLIVACASCRFREGGTWTTARMDGTRKPALRQDKVDADRVRVVAFDRDQGRALANVAAEFRGGRVFLSRSRAGLGLAAGVLLSAAVFAGTRVAYSAPRPEGGQLVVSFKHPGTAGDGCHTLTEAEKAALPPHMRRDVVCARGRADVRVRVEVDGEEVLSRGYAPRGLWGDGNSVAVERIAVPTGTHRVSVAIGDTADPAAWAFTDAREVVFAGGEQRVVLFDRLAGFGWY